jgi:hypothetical protein
MASGERDEIGDGNEANGERPARRGAKALARQGAAAGGRSEEGTDRFQMTEDAWSFLSLSRVPSRRQARATKRMAEFELSLF